MICTICARAGPEGPEPGGEKGGPLRKENAVVLESCESMLYVGGVARLRCTAATPSGAGHRKLGWGRTGALQATASCGGGLGLGPSVRSARRTHAAPRHIQDRLHERQ